MLKVKSIKRNSTIISKRLLVLHKAGHEVILVSSGAVAAGFARLGYSSRPITIKGKQAASAVGQGLLMQSYIEKFSVHGIVPAQILLTRIDFSNRERYRNAFATLTELLERGILPIINENDTVSVEELTFGDNDMLSALVSGFLHADQLIILTDINGLYESNPRKYPLAKRLDYLEQITDDLLKGADDTGSKVGTGGMKSKLLAAKTATSLGVSVFIGTGEGSDKLLRFYKAEGMEPIFQIRISRKLIRADNGLCCIPNRQANFTWIKGRKRPFCITEKAYYLLVLLK